MDNQPISPAAPSPPQISSSPHPKSSRQYFAVIVLAVIALILVVGLFLVTISKNNHISDLNKQLKDAQTKNSQQTKLAGTINKNDYQAVFLDDGHVYFGKVSVLSDQYFKITNIYYLQNGGQGLNDSTTSNSNVSLVKLGCELHAPRDEMTINANNVSFLENLKSNGQVVKAINDFSQNPGGADCSNS